MKTAPFVGRNPEVASLMQRLSESLAGQPQIVFISGEAGVGKSRLIEEFLLRVRESYPKLIAATGYCNSHFGHSDTLHPFRQILMELLDERKDDKPSSRAQQLAKKVREWAWDLAPDVVG
ncbi:MAG TPA: AAA family ATPase, partial [Anaerolineales bacterium]|nr:AAA family ATPase [Anaerolineales bacterium]